MCVCMPKILRGEWRRRDCGVTIPPGSDFSLSVSLSLSLCLSGEHTHLAKTSPKKKKERLRITVLSKGHSTPVSHRNGGQTESELSLHVFSLTNSCCALYSYCGS